MTLSESGVLSEAMFSFAWLLTRCCSGDNRHSGEQPLGMTVRCHSFDQLEFSDSKGSKTHMLTSKPSTCWLEQTTQGRAASFKAFTLELECCRPFS